MENHGFSAVLAEKPCLINATTVWIPLPHAAMMSDRLLCARIPVVHAAPSVPKSGHQIDSGDVSNWGG
ncbi:hypothetical protein AMK05_CH00817 [Rhizobium sp. N324]|nr:hypothetical protein AMK05_CH00817 [Rhizobium sp. N324]OYD02814.1 hypothetical protein AMK08_CH100813 [Rhizobium sp. N4311]